MINWPLIIASFLITFAGWNYFYFKNKSNDKPQKKSTKKSATALRAFDRVGKPKASKR